MRREGPTLLADTLHVELAGLPGAGKTTIVESAAAILQTRGYRCLLRADVVGIATLRGRRMRRLRYLASVVMFGMAHPALLLQLGRVIRRAGYKNRSVYKRCRTAFRLTAAINSVTRQQRHAPVVLLLDQGIYQILWSLYVRADPAFTALPRRWLDDLLKHLAHPAVVGFVEVDTGVAHHRVRERPRELSLVASMDEATSRGLFNESREFLYSTLPGAAKRNGVDRAVTIDGSLPADTNAQVLADMVEQAADRR